MKPKKETGIGISYTKSQRLHAWGRRGGREENIWQQYRFLSNQQLQASIEKSFLMLKGFSLRYQLVMKHNQRYYIKVDAVFIAWLSVSPH